MAVQIISQDPVQLAPQHYHTILDNDRLRMVDVRIPAGAHVPMHSHPTMCLYSLNRSRIRFTFPDGTTQDVEMREGDSHYQDGLNHAVDNIGASEAHILLVEFKR